MLKELKKLLTFQTYSNKITLERTFLIKKKKKDENIIGPF